MEKNKNSWIVLALMAFTSVWGFGNVTNGFFYFEGIKSIIPWIVIFALYFIPYALMVGELGSAFKEEGGGVSSWINRTIGAKLAYYAGWTYWACHIAYIVNKSSSSLKSLSWIIFRNAETYDAIPSYYIQIATLAVFLIACFIAVRGINPLKKLLTIAGGAGFVMSILYIIMMFAAPAINPTADYVNTSINFQALLPNLSVAFFTSLSILVFAVGGSEKISPYVNKVKNPSKDFPKGMIALAIMVVVCAVLGTIAMSKMFDPAVFTADTATLNSYIANGQYWAFQKLGNYYHIGDSLLIIYAVSRLITEFSVIILSIDAPLRMLLDNEQSREFIPTKLHKKNKHGAYINGIWLVVILCGGLIVIQSIVPGASNIISQLIKLNSVCMPIRYLWVFAAYIALRKHFDTIDAEYRFVKNQPLAKFFGVWCFLITAVCICLGMYSEDTFTLILNIATPLFLFTLGLVMPLLAKREKKKC